MHNVTKQENGVLGFNIRWFDEIDSTNTRLVEQVRLEPEMPSGTVWAARIQTAGRGRWERKWISSTSSNLLFSLYYRPSTGLSYLPSLSMAMAIAIDEMLHGLRVFSNLKWPNDVHVRGRKIAGLLAERAGDDGVVIGVGLNINMMEGEMAQIDQPATSLKAETGKDWDVEAVLETLLGAHFPPWLSRWETGGFSGFRERWILGCGGLSAPLIVRDGENKIQGTLAGFGEEGELLLSLPDGEIQTVWAGDVAFPSCHIK